MKKFFKALVAGAICAAIVSTVAFAADGTVFKKDFEDGATGENGKIGSLEAIEVKDVEGSKVLYFKAKAAYTAPYFSLGESIKKVMDDNKLTDATVTVTMDIMAASEEESPIRVLLRGINNRVTEKQGDGADGEGNKYSPVASQVAGSEVEDWYNFEASFEVSEDDLKGIAAGDTYNLTFDSMDDGKEFYIDNITVTIDELSGNAGAAGDTNNANNNKPANKPSNTGDVLPVMTVALLAVASTILVIVNKKKREI